MRNPLNIAFLLPTIISSVSVMICRENLLNNPHEISRVQARIFSIYVDNLGQHDLVVLFVKCVVAQDILSSCIYQLLVYCLRCVSPDRGIRMASTGKGEVR
uniref:Secreted protein n=1 Tax=Opuntia streptacantha TaxID=393608 RepID=A0A7C9D460_OPUST